MIRTFVFLASLAIATTGAATAAPPSGAASVVNSFYQWYFATGPSGSWTDRFPQAKGFFDPSLYASLSKMLAEERREHAAVLDFDPFVFAQEPASSFSLGTPVTSGALVKVPVTLHFAHGAGHVTAIVRLAGTWQIQNISYGADGNLRTMLAQAMK
ncbi:MAG TPA: hypothetical protein VGF86_04055 [Candidatus Tumulicola sp.]|jgi:hypothetical protein